MSFLAIPSQEGLFATIKSGKSSEEAHSRCPMHEDDDEEDEEDEEECVRFIPRCSPVPRKRGASIYDETAEYMRIHQALSAAKKVSFADTTGGDLVDVKEFVAFDSDEDEEDIARWEEEEAKYRKPDRETTFRVQPEFCAPAGSALLQAVRRQKVEVERMCPVEGEPLAVTGLIRVLNISFHKAVYIRSTMDSWVSYFDHPAEYVQGSHDGDTDQFSFKLSFAPPYTTHGSRMEFVVRYETSDGDFWANNSSMNYVVTLILSYEEDSTPTDMEAQQKRGILKPPKAYSMNDDEDSEDEREEEEEEAGTCETGLVRPTAVCPVIVQPEIDIEIAVKPSGPSVAPRPEPPSVGGTPSARTLSPGERLPRMSSGSALETHSPLALCASQPARPSKSPLLPTMHAASGNQTSTRPLNESPCAPHPSAPERGLSSGSARESPPSLASGGHPPATETHLRPTGEDASRPSAPSVARGFGAEVESGLREPEAGLSEGSTQFSAPHSEKRDAPQNAPGVLEDLSNAWSAASEPRRERDANRNPMPSIIIFLSGVVCLSVVMREPAALCLIGLFLFLRRS